MIDLAISLLVGAGVVCGTHHSHTVTGTDLPFPHHSHHSERHTIFLFPPTPQRARFEPFFWPFLLEEGRGLGLPFWPEPVPPPSPRASMAAACSPSSLQHLPWRKMCRFKTNCVIHLKQFASLPRKFCAWNHQCKECSE